MRVCLVSQEYPPETGGGGIGTQTFLKAHGLTARGHEVHVLSASPDAQPHTYMDGLAHLHRFPYPQLNVPGFEMSTCWLAYSTAVAGKLHELNEAIGFDIIQFPEYGGEGFVYQTDTYGNRSARYVVQCHGPLGMFTEHMGWPDRGSTLDQVGCFMERTAIHHADLVLASSHNTAAFCADRYDYPLEKINVIHSGIDPQRFQQIPSPPNDGKPRILFVGNIVASKGIGRLVDAVLSVRDEFPNIRLRAIGKGDPDYLRNLNARVAAAGASECVELMGYVPYAELPKQYAWSDFFAGPSEFEPGPGNVYLEAMACGRPVIACDTAGAPEVVLHERTGLLVPPADPKALVNAIERLARDADWRAQLGANGRTWIEERFTIERYIDRVENAYVSILAQPIANG